MVELNPSSFRVKPFAHQLEGVRRLIAAPNFALFDEMGVGKSKQIVDAACALAEAGEVSLLLIVCPASVKTVWLDRELGEVQRYTWVPTYVEEFSSRNLELGNGVFVETKLHVVVVSYEFIRQEHRRQELIRFVRRQKTWLVLDESSYIKSPRAQQTKAVLALRPACRRATILNGTPIANNVLDLYCQFAALDKQILGFSSYYAFRARHANMGGYLNKQVIGFRNVEEVERKVAPFVLRREKRDCLDLPDKIRSRAEVALTSETWSLYKQMRDDMVAWLANEPSITNHAVVKILRLSQITSGFLGGFVDPDDPTSTKPREISDEKTVFLLNWLADRFSEDPTRRIVVWCRFRAEIARLFERATSGRYFHLGRILRLEGEQSRKEREESVAMFHPDNRDGKGALLIAQPAAGKFGLNFSGATMCPYLSNDYNLLTRLQSEDRLHRPGQLWPVYVLDVLATGPKGQKTVDHHVTKALSRKENLATATIERWRELLAEE